MSQGRLSIEQDDFQIQISGAKLVGADAPVWTSYLVAADFHIIRDTIGSISEYGK